MIDKGGYISIGCVLLALPKRRSIPRNPNTYIIEVGNALPACETNAVDEGAYVLRRLLYQKRCGWPICWIDHPEKCTISYVGGGSTIPSGERIRADVVLLLTWSKEPILRLELFPNRLGVIYYRIF